MDYVEMVAKNAKANSRSPKEFLELCRQRGLKITYPDTFINIYYYGHHKIKKDCNSALIEPSCES